MMAGFWFGRVAAISVRTERCYRDHGKKRVYVALTRKIFAREIKVTVIAVNLIGFSRF
jgi:hypothetical protein